MKIAWFCIPAYGHTNPTLAVVKELTDAGHQVFYFSFDLFKEQIEKTGATYISCDECHFEMKDQGNADRIGKDKIFAAELLVSSTLAMDPIVTEKVKTIQPDLIVSDSVAYWGKLAAMKFHIPYVSSTTTFAFNRYSAKYMKESPSGIIRMIFSMPKINHQLDRLREHGYPIRSLLDIVQNDNNTNTIVYTSRLFQPCADTFSKRYHFIGPSIRPMTKPMAKTARTTIYLSMGTINHNKEFYENAIQTLGNTDWQVIISMGTNAEHFDHIPDNIQIYQTVDQMAALSISDIFITHCGMNSVNEALYYKVPLIMFPQTTEQGAVARRVSELQAGIYLPSIKPQDILQSINTILQDPVYQQNAEGISDSFHHCGGAPEARIFLEEIIRENGK